MPYHDDAISMPCLLPYYCHYMLRDKMLPATRRRRLLIRCYCYCYTYAVDARHAMMLMRAITPRLPRHVPPPGRRFFFFATAAMLLMLFVMLRHAYADIIFRCCHADACLPCARYC